MCTGFNYHFNSMDHIKGAQADVLDEAFEILNLAASKLRMWDLATVYMPILRLIVGV